MVGRGLRLILFTLLGLILLLAATFAWWWPGLVESGRAQLAARGVKLVGPEEFSWQGRTLLLSGIGLGDGLRVEELSLTFNSPLGAQFWRRPLERVRLSDYTINLREDGSGKWQLPGLQPELLRGPARPAPSSPATGPAAESSPSSPTPADAAPAALIPPAWQERLPRLDLDRGAISLQARQGQISFTLGSFSFQPELAGAGELQLAGEFAFAVPPLTGEELQVGGRLGLTLLPEPGRLALSSLQLQLSDLEVTAAAHDLHLLIPSASLTLDDFGFDPLAERVRLGRAALRVSELLGRQKIAARSLTIPQLNLELSGMEMGRDLFLTGPPNGSTPVSDVKDRSLPVSPPISAPISAGLQLEQITLDLTALYHGSRQPEEPEAVDKLSLELAWELRDFSLASAEKAAASRMELRGRGQLAVPELSSPLSFTLAGDSAAIPTPFTRLDLQLRADEGEGEAPVQGQISSSLAFCGLIRQFLAESAPLPFGLEATLMLQPWPELLGLDLAGLGLTAPLSGHLRIKQQLLLGRSQLQLSGGWQGSLNSPTLTGSLALESRLQLTAAEMALTLHGPEAGAALRLDLLSFGLPLSSPASPESEPRRQLLDGVIELRSAADSTSASPSPLLSLHRAGADQPELAAGLDIQLSYPLHYRDSANPELDLALAGGVGLDLGNGSDGSWRLRLEPALKLGVIAEQLAELELNLTGGLIGHIDRSDRISLHPDPALLMTLLGRAGDISLLRPATFKLDSLPDRPLLTLIGKDRKGTDLKSLPEPLPDHNHGGRTELAARLVSHGPRLDLDLAGTRLVARSDSLQLEVAGYLPVKFPVETPAANGRQKGDLTLDLTLRELLFPSLLLAAHDLRLTARQGSTSGLPQTLTFELGRFRDAALSPRFAPLGLNLALRFDDERLSGGGDLRLGLDDPRPLPLALLLDLAADGGEGRLEWKNHAIELGGSGFDLRQLLPPLQPEIPELLGRARLGGKIFWDSATPLTIDNRLGLSDFQISLTPRELLEEGEIKLIGGHIVLQLAGELTRPEELALTTHLDAVTIITPQASIYGLEGLDLLLHPLLPPHTPQPLTITFDELSGFLPFERGRLQLSLEHGKSLQLHALEMYLGDGLVRARPLTVELAEPAGELYLEVEGVQLARLNEKLQIELRESLEVEGVLDGVLPIHFSPAGVKLVDAELSARGPGIMRYRPGDPTDWLQKTGKSTMQLALSNYHFATFRLGLQGDLGEAITVELHTAGANRDLLRGLPVDLKLKIHANLEKLLSAYSGSVGHAERTYVILD